MLIGVLDHVPNHLIGNFPIAMRKKWEKWSEQYPTAAGSLEQNLLDCRSVNGYYCNPNSDDEALKYGNSIRIKVESLGFREKCPADDDLMNAKERAAEKSL